MVELFKYLSRLAPCCGVVLLLGVLSLLSMLAALRLFEKKLNRLNREHRPKLRVRLILTYGEAVAIGFVVFAGTFGLLLWLLNR